MKRSKRNLFILAILCSSSLYADEKGETQKSSVWPVDKYLGAEFSTAPVNPQPAPAVSFLLNKKEKQEEEIDDGPKLSLLPRNPDALLMGSSCKVSLSPMGNQPLYGLVSDMGLVSSFSAATYSPLYLSQSNCSINKTKYLLKESRFNFTRCENLVGCTEQRLFSVDAEKKRKFHELVNGYAAKEFAKNFLKSKIDSMEKLELLKKFAQKKFDPKIGQSCASRFSARESQCQISTVVDGFKEFHRTCSFPQIGCYSKATLDDELPDFITYDSKFKEKTGNSVQSFFDKKVEITSRKYSAFDKVYLDKLGDLLISPAFKEASVVEKEDMFVAALKEHGYTDGVYIDPIMNADFNLSSKDNKSIKDHEQFKHLKAIILKNNVSKADFIAQFDKYRKNRAETLLKDTCDNVPTIENLCKSVTSLKLGIRSTVDIDNISLANIISDKTFPKDSPEFKAVKELMGEYWDENDLENALDAKRCNAFGYAEKVSRGGRGLRLKINDDDVYNLGATSESSRKGQRYGSTSSEGMDDETMKSLGLGKTDNSKDVASAIKDEAAAAEETKRSTAAQHYPGEDTFTNNYFNPNTFTPASNLADKEVARDEGEASKTVDSATVKAETDSSSATDAKVAELIKKLALTEDKLDKLKASTEAADEARAKEKKIAEENALIADLKGQINELKNKSVINKAAVIQAPVARQEEVQVAPRPVDFTISSRSNSDAGTSSHSADVPDARSADSSSSATAASSASASLAGRSIASAPQLTAVNADNGIEQSSGLVLTRVDGMSSEKAIETISNKILELNGIPFLIEEDGITKKVIPLIRDGKIDLDENGNPKYVKIKVNRKECTDEEKASGKCRAPANVASKQNSSVADEKREQEERVRREIERAQYLKLKALTNKALSKPAAPKSK